MLTFFCVTKIKCTLDLISKKYSLAFLGGQMCLLSVKMSQL